MKLSTPLLAVVFFSTYTTISKKIVHDVYPILLILYIRVLSIIVFSFFLGLFPELKKTMREAHHRHGAFFTFSLLSGAIAPMFLLFGLQYTTAINASLLVNSYSIFLLGCSIFLFKEKISIYRYLGMGVLLFGVSFILLEGQFKSMSLNIGDLLVIIGQAAYCASDVVYKTKLKYMRSDVAILGRNLVSFFIFFVFAIFMFKNPFYQINEHTFPYIILLSLLPVLSAQFLWYKSVKKHSAVTLSRLRLLYPFFAVIFATIFLGEALYFYHFIGGALVIAGMMISQIKKQPHWFHHGVHLRHGFK